MSSSSLVRNMSLMYKISSSKDIFFATVVLNGTQQLEISHQIFQMHKVFGKTFTQISEFHHKNIYFFFSGGYSILSGSHHCMSMLCH